jgi:lipoprotein-releasing system permease protein
VNPANIVSFANIPPRTGALLVLLLVFAIVFSVVFAHRVRRHFRDREIGRVVLWALAMLAALGSVGLATVSAALPELGRHMYRMSHEIIRVSALLSTVIFVVFVLASLLPLVLDALERGGFVSFVGARLVRSNKSGFLTVISVLSILGVAVSSCALCSVTSIMGGFGHDLKSKILGNTAHIIIDVKGPGGFRQWQPALDAVRGVVVPLGGQATPVVGGEAMASSATNTAGTLLRGVDAETIGQVINLKDNLEVGNFDYLLDPSKLISLPPDEVVGRGPGGEAYLKGPGLVFPDARIALPKKRLYPGIIVGRELAKSLHVMVGDELTMLSPMGELGPTGIMPRSRKFRVAGVFYSGMYEYDASHAYVLLDVAQRFFSLEGRISTIDVRIPEPEVVTTVTPLVVAAVASLNRSPPPGDKIKPLRVRDWKAMNKNLFSALKLEKIATFIILSIAIAVASFCIICTLLLMVTEKSKEIAVLKALGASDRAVMKIFMLEGTLIGAIGTVLGVAVALAQCLGLSWTGVRLDPDVYYIDRLPVNVDPGDYAVVTLAAFLICTLATIYPAITASRVRPIDGLRYE